MGGRNSSPTIKSVPGVSCDFDALGHKHGCPCCQRAKGPRQYVWWETRHCDWCAPVEGGVLSSPLRLWPAFPILQARTLSISSHYSVTWNRGGGGQKKIPHHLFHLLNESNFLPESTRPARTSTATLNYLTLIQINKRHRDQDSVIPQRQSMTTRLYHNTETASYAIPTNIGQ